MLLNTNLKNLDQSNDTLQKMQDNLDETDKGELSKLNDVENIKVE